MKKMNIFNRPLHTTMLNFSCRALYAVIYLLFSTLRSSGRCTVLWSLLTRIRTPRTADARNSQSPSRGQQINVSQTENLIGSWELNKHQEPCLPQAFKILMKFYYFPVDNWKTVDHFPEPFQVANKTVYIAPHNIRGIQHKFTKKKIIIWWC